MKTKIIPLSILGILISLSALSQTTENSSHPKLDAFRKLKQNSREAVVSDTSATPKVNTATGNNIKTSNDSSPSSTATGNSTTTSNNSSPTSSSPIVTGNKTISTNNAGTQNQPNPPVQTMPAQKQIYMDTRLGSSTKQYDTYEKNNNGAGSVTTSPK